jgi:hypothetical protein
MAGPGGLWFDRLGDLILRSSVMTDMDNFKDWRTTVPALIASTASLVVFAPDLFSAGIVLVAKWVMAGGLALFGINSNSKGT